MSAERRRPVPTVVLSAVQVSRVRLSELRPETSLPEPFPWGPCCLRWSG